MATPDNGKDCNRRPKQGMGRFKTIKESVLSALGLTKSCKADRQGYQTLPPDVKLNCDSFPSNKQFTNVREKHTGLTQSAKHKNKTSNNLLNGSKGQGLAVQLDENTPSLCHMEEKDEQVGGINANSCRGSEDQKEVKTQTSSHFSAVVVFPTWPSRVDKTAKGLLLDGETQEANQSGMDDNVDKCVSFDETNYDNSVINATRSGSKKDMILPHNVSDFSEDFGIYSSISDSIDSQIICPTYECNGTYLPCQASMSNQMSASYTVVARTDRSSKNSTSRHTPTHCSDTPRCNRFRACPVYEPIGPACPPRHYDPWHEHLSKEAFADRDQHAMIMTTRTDPDVGHTFNTAKPYCIQDCTQSTNNERKHLKQMEYLEINTEDGSSQQYAPKQLADNQQMPVKGQFASAQQDAPQHLCSYPQHPQSKVSLENGDKHLPEPTYCIIMPGTTPFNDTKIHNLIGESVGHSQPNRAALHKNVGLYYNQTRDAGHMCCFSDPRVKLNAQVDEKKDKEVQTDLHISCSRFDYLCKSCNSLKFPIAPHCHNVAAEEGRISLENDYIPCSFHRVKKNSLNHNQSYTFAPKTKPWLDSRNDVSNNPVKFQDGNVLKYGFPIKACEAQETTHQIREPEFINGVEHSFATEQDVSTLETDKAPRRHLHGHNTRYVAECAIFTKPNESQLQYNQEVSPKIALSNRTDIVVTSSDDAASVVSSDTADADFIYLACNSIGNQNSIDPSRYTNYSQSQPFLDTTWMQTTQQSRKLCKDSQSYERLESSRSKSGRYGSSLDEITKQFFLDEDALSDDVFMDETIEIFNRCPARRLSTKLSPPTSIISTKIEVQNERYWHEAENERRGLNYLTDRHISLFPPFIEQIPATEASADTQELSPNKTYDPIPNAKEELCVSTSSGDEVYRYAYMYDDIDDVLGHNSSTDTMKLETRCANNEPQYENFVSSCENDSSNTAPVDSDMNQDMNLVNVHISDPNDNRTKPSTYANDEDDANETESLGRDQVFDSLRRSSSIQSRARQMWRMRRAKNRKNPPWRAPIAVNSTNSNNTENKNCQPPKTDLLKEFGTGLPCPAVSSSTPARLKGILKKTMVDYVGKDIKHWSPKDANMNLGAEEILSKRRARSLGDEVFPLEWTEVLYQVEKHLISSKMADASSTTWASDLIKRSASHSTTVGCNQKQRRCMSLTTGASLLPR